MVTLSIVATSAALLALSGLTASAGVNKTWVSGTGVDRGTCTYAAPCATIQYAINQTNAAGEVDIKDTGGYGTFTITQSISVIAADGVLATINVAKGAEGINVSANPNDSIFLKGISINGHSQGSNTGVLVSRDANVTLEKCVIVGNQYGIVLNTNSSHGFISDNIFIGNIIGIYGPSMGTLVIGGNRITSNYIGVEALNISSYGNNEINGNMHEDVDSTTTIQKNGSVLQ